MTKLEVLHRMYKDLIKKGVGTVTVEAEMMRMIHEREAGPTGHRMFAREKRNNCQKERECDKEEEMDFQCWRDVKTARKLLTLRKRVVAGQLKLARRRLTDEMRFLSATLTKEETKLAWSEVEETKREVWKLLHPQHQRKVDHLQKRAENCKKHRMCKKLSDMLNLKLKKLDRDSDPDTEEHCDKNSDDNHGENEDEDDCETDVKDDGDTGDLMNTDEWIENLVLESRRSRRVLDMLEDETEDNCHHDSTCTQPHEEDLVTTHQVVDSISLPEDNNTTPTPMSTPTTNTNQHNTHNTSQPQDTNPQHPHNKDTTSTPTRETTRDKLFTKYRTREEDLKKLEQESEEVLQRTFEFNRRTTEKMINSKNENDENDRNDNTDEVVVWGDIELTDSELDLLSLGPGFMVVENLDKQEMKIESNVTLTKIRWGRRKLGTDEMTGRQEDVELEDVDEEKTTLADLLETEARDVLGPDNMSVDMRRKRATDMRGNRRVMMPGTAPACVEAEYNTRTDVWEKAFGTYMDNNCDKTGQQNVTNLSKNQLLGLKTIQKKVAKNEVVILEADKGKRFVVVSEQDYISMARVHTAGDSVADTEDIRESQRILSSTAKGLANVLDLGSAQSKMNYERCIDNCGSTAHDVPGLRLMPKVHKPPSQDGLLQSRPVVSAAAGVSSRAGDQMADFLTPVVAAQYPRMEDLSTEEVMMQLREAQVHMKDTKARNTMAGSLDVRALYPSLDQEGSARIVADFVKKTPTKIEGIDYQYAQIFIASNMDLHELKKDGLLSLVPKRKKKKGPRPGKTTEELWKKKGQTEVPGPKTDDNNLDKKRTESKWEDTIPESSLSEDNKRTLLATVCLIATRLIFKYHVYSFAGEVYRQACGGPIGLRFTSIVSRIVMDYWLCNFLKVLDDAGVRVFGAMKYVDDVNLVVSMVCLGTRWIDGQLIHKQEWEDQDKNDGRSVYDITMEAMRIAAESILPWLGFTVDYPSKHDNNMVPVLDVQVWVESADLEDVDSFDTLCWTFFEKPTAAKRVLLASSAYNWRSKLVTLNMEVFRRMKNTTRQLNVRTRVNILCQFVLKLRKSGYIEKTVDGIVRSGLKFYERKIRMDLEGGPPIYRRSEEDTLQRRRKKLGATEQWFSRRRGGARETEAKTNGWRNREPATTRPTARGQCQGQEDPQVPHSKVLHNNK